MKPGDEIDIFDEKLVQADFVLQLPDLSTCFGLQRLGI